jgi:hypothetical protein
MKDRKNSPMISVVIALVLSWLTMPAWAELSSSAIEKIVQEAGVFDPQDKLSVQVKGTEVFVYTYVSSRTKDISKDAKINTVLLAKNIMDKEPTVMRVTTRFYEPQSTDSYYTVSVSLGDVKAFATGAIKEDQLLNSLELHKIKGASASATSTDAYKKQVASALNSGEKSASPEAGGSSSSVESTGKVKHSEDAFAKLDRQVTNYSGYGISFDYPVSFKMRPRSEEDKFLLASFENELTGSHEINVELQFMSGGKTVQEWAQELAAYHSRLDGYQKVQAPAVITFGPQKISGINEIFAFTHRHHHREAEAVSAPPRYEHDVYFGWPNRVYNVKIYCYREDYQKAAQAFETILHSLRVATAAK